MAVSPPRPLDIPLSQLRAFEAAARLGGFAAAGAEIGVSAGAITAHIKALEARLGAPLFRRSAKGVVLTALGRRALPEVTQAFDALSQRHKANEAHSEAKTEQRVQDEHAAKSFRNDGR